MDAHLASATELELAPLLREALARWALARHPHEACGLLLGQRVGERVTVHDVREACNRAGALAHERFELDPGDHRAIEDEARARGLVVVGAWHSHPDRAAVPSEADRAAAWPEWIQVILAVSGTGVRELRAWRPAGQRFVELVLLS